MAMNGKLVTLKEQAGEAPNGTSFMITTGPTPELDKTNLVVGKVSWVGIEMAVQCRMGTDDAGQVRGTPSCGVEFLAVPAVPASLPRPMGQSCKTHCDTSGFLAKVYAKAGQVP